MRWPTRLSSLIVLGGFLPAYAAAQAQSTSGTIRLDQYQPTPFSDRLLRLDGPTTLPFSQFRVGLDVDYAFRPLVLTDAMPGIFQAGSGPDHLVVRHAVGGTLAASFGLSHGLEAALSLPLTLFQNGEKVPGAVSPSAAGVGNPSVGIKARLFDVPSFGAGAAILAALPYGVGTLTHDGGFGGEARVFGEYRPGPLTVGLRGGFRLRSAQTFYDIPVRNELTFVAGISWKLAVRTTILAELAGATAAAQPFSSDKQTPIEGLVGLRQRVGKTWFTLAGGPGLRDGYGSPLFRVVAAFVWANRPPDLDGDGIPDDDDRCPTDPEDRDGFQDADGCPDPDNDNDGIPDAADKCPNEPEDRDGFEDADGCPDPDNDKDGIGDKADKCPNEPETVNAFEDDDGCPDENPTASDKDKDGLADDVDECPEEPEDKDGFEDEDGCPEPDNDKDGILDGVDKCPLEPETINGIDDEDGCPDKGQTQVRLGKNEIETLQPIYFDTDRSRVRHAFYNVLGQVALLLKAHPEIGRCAVEGHTDDTGPPDWNQKLSMLRAESVIEFLANKGADPKRLVAIGRGEHLPWASNETLEGRAKNRRVVFHIEGVNLDDQKKQEQRQERRRSIRHKREHDRAEKQPVGSTRKEDATAAPPVDRADAPSTKPPATPGEPAGRPTRGEPPTPAPSPSSKSPPSAPASGAPGRAKSDTAPAPKAAPPTAPSAVPGAPARPAVDTDDADDADTTEGRPPTSPPKRRPADAPNTGLPPTLRELLKLPPR